MSFSFGVKAATTQEARDQAFVKMTEVCEQQPSHAHDAENCMKVVDSMIALITPDADKDVAISVSGWLSWTGGDTTTPQAFTGASVSVSVTLAQRQVQHQPV